MTNTTPDLECINSHPDSPSECRGPVELRTPLSATGTPFPRCDFHWDKRLTLEDELRVNYPDSPIPPNWFDPTVAGERWNEDD
jgi:hypothetical protein